MPSFGPVSSSPVSSLESAASFEYTGSGGIVLGGNALYNAELFIGFDSSWGIESIITAEFDSAWDVGNSPLRYYRILGKCTGANCNDIGVQPNDGKCGSPPPDGVRFLTTLAARNLADLCSRLTNLQYNPPIHTQIERIDLYSRPVERPGVQRTNNSFGNVVKVVDRSGNVIGVIDADPPVGITLGSENVGQVGRELGVPTLAEKPTGTTLVPIVGLPAPPVDQSCNTLTPQDFCDIPECWEFCIDEKPVVVAGVSIRVTEAFHQHVGSGGIVLGGEAEVIFVLQHCMSGGMVFSGNAEVVSSAFSFVGEGGMVLGGGAEVVSSAFSFVGEGEMVFGGGAEVVSSAFSFVGTGGIQLSGSAVHSPTCLEPIGAISPLMSLPYYPDEPYIVLSGSAEIHAANWHFVGEVEGGMELSGSGEHVSSYYQYEGSGGIVLGGFAETVSPYYAFEMNGGIELEGEARLGFSVGVGGDAELSGSAEILLTFNYEMDGSIILDGLVGGDDLLSPVYNYIGDGGLELSGEAEIDSSLMGLFPVVAGAYFFIEDLTVEFDELLASSDLTIDDEEVESACGCGSAPLVLLCYHNLSQGNFFKDFMASNGITLGEYSSIRYRTGTSSWQENIHMSGIGVAGGSERWRVLLEWGCSENIAGEELGSPFWKFSMLITRSNLSNGLDTETRFLVTIPPEFVCNESGTVDVEIKLNVQSGNATIRTGEPDIVVFKDRIGFFKGRYWQQMPLRIRIREGVTSSAAPVYDIQPIFPVSV